WSRMSATICRRPRLRSPTARGSSAPCPTSTAWTASSRPGYARATEAREIALESRATFRYTTLVPAIAPSILSADFGRLADEVRAAAAAGADWLHVDVMDGHFVPPITVGPAVVEALRRATTLPLDVHLMIQHPERHVSEFVRAGATGVTVHVEAETDVPATLAAIRAAGARPGLALNPPPPRSARCAAARADVRPGGRAARPRFRPAPGSGHTPRLSRRGPWKRASARPR